MAIHAPKSVLVIEDDPDTRANLCDILEMDGYHVYTAGTVAQALHRETWTDISTIILDYRLPDGNAETLLPKLRELAPKASVIVSTGVGGLSGAILAVRQGAADYIVKPLDADILRASLRRIRERQELALAKERSDAAFRSLIEAAPCMIVILRPDRTISYFSPFAEELTGYSTKEAIGRDCFSLFAPELPSELVVKEKVAHIMSGKPTRGFESPIICKDGSRRWIVWNFQLLSAFADEPSILAVGQDITSLKHAQEQALQSERLAAIGQMMTGLAHESGNALARSQACLEMLAFALEDQPKALNLITRIQSAQDHLKQLYEEVRNYAAPLKLQLESWNLASIWRQAWANLAMVRREKVATLQENVGGLDLNLLIDQFRFEQVFRNIFDNALAACPENVEMKIVCSRDSVDGQPAVRIACRDNGPGLTPEQRRRIFDPFYTTKTKGTGLGMAITKRIVEAHGGRIEVGAETRSGNGTEIIITIPSK